MGLLISSASFLLLGDTPGWSFMGTSCRVCLRYRRRTHCVKREAAYQMKPPASKRPHTRKNPSVTEKLSAGAELIPTSMGETTEMNVSAAGSDKYRAALSASQANVNPNGRPKIRDRRMW